MGNYEYYQELAETIFFQGMDSRTLLQIARYKTGKTFADVVSAVNRRKFDGLGQIENELGCIADRLSEVLDIDASEPFCEYKEKLIRLRKLAKEKEY